MRVNYFCENENKKELCFIVSACSSIEENESLMSLLLENITLNEYSLHLIVTTNMFVPEVSQCNEL